MFKVTAQLTNVRPSKSSEPEVSTTPTKGTIKLNAPAASKIGVTVGDYAAIVEAEDANGKGLYIVKGHEGNKEEKISQVGAALASTSGNAGGSLHFSSENAFRTLGGTKEGVKKVYSVGEAVTPGDGNTYFKLDYVRDEARQERKEKANA